MIPIPLITGLISLVPDVVRLIGGEKKGKAVEKVFEVARQVTGAGNDADAVMGMQNNTELALRFKSSVMEHEREILRMRAEEAEEERASFNKRIADMEGTASDLKSIPVLGAAMLFLRGSIRPVWCALTLYWTSMWFSSMWDIPDDSQKSMAFFLNLILTLTFVFGERAIKNCLPLVREFLNAKAGRAKW